MPHSYSRGPWEEAAAPGAAPPSSRAGQPVLLHAVIRPSRADGRKPAVIFGVVAVLAVALSLPFLLRGVWIVAIIFSIELSALALATRAWRRRAAQSCEELRLFPDRLEIHTRTGGRTTIDRLPTAWLTIEAAGCSRRGKPGLVLHAAQRRLSIGAWLGPAQSADLRRTLENALALARRGGLAASTAPALTWSSRDALPEPVDPADWAGGPGRS